MRHLFGIFLNQQLIPLEFMVCPLEKATEFKSATAPMIQTYQSHLCETQLIFRDPTSQIGSNHQRSLFSRIDCWGSEHLFGKGWLQTWLWLKFCCRTLFHFAGLHPHESRSHGNSLILWHTNIYPSSQQNSKSICKSKTAMCCECASNEQPWIPEQTGPFCGSYTQWKK